MSAPLELSPDEMRQMADAVVSRCLAHLASIRDMPASGDTGAAALCRAMREPAPESPAALGPLVDTLFDEYIPRSLTTIAGGYLGYIPGGGLYPAALADFIADTTNRFTGIWPAAPALVQLEANALDWLRDWMGLPVTARGLFTTGGSSATFNAIVCAREKKLGSDIRRGVLYTSDQAHHSVAKAAKLAGIMPDRVHVIPSDDRFRMGADPLADAIAADRRAGLLPFAVVSAAGTTNTGAVDPLDAIADLSAREGLWHHVDGAYGAFFRLGSETAAALHGIERADSLTLDPHKGMFLPYGTGALLVRDGADLRAAHEASAGYLPALADPEEFYDPSQYGPDLSRGFPGLRVWLSVKLFGAAAFREAIAEKRALAVDAAARLAKIRGIVLDAEPELSLFPFHVARAFQARDPSEENELTRKLVADVTARGRVLVTGCTTKDRFYGRVCVLSFRTHQRHIDALVEDVEASLASLRANCL